MKPLLMALLFLPTIVLADPRPVVSEVVLADPTSQRIFHGVVEADSVSVLGFLTVGRLATLDVAAGDQVAAGDTLATLDQITLQQDVAAAQAALRSANAQADAAVQSLERAQELSQRGVAATDRLEAAQKAHDTAAAQVAIAEADLVRANDAARYGILVAPTDGVVLSTAIEPGTVVTAGEPVVRVAAISGREAVLDVPADYADLLGQDARFLIHSRAQGAADVIGTLKLIEPVADPSVRGRRIRVTLPAVGPDFRIGSLITAELIADEMAVMTLPLSAVDDGTVWRVDPASRAVSTVAVQTGRTVADRIEVTQGLSVGDEVIIKGIHSLTEGQIVGERIE